jgi:hypothetical protein
MHARADTHALKINNKQPSAYLAGTRRAGEVGGAGGVSRANMTVRASSTVRVLISVCPSGALRCVALAQ